MDRERRKNIPASESCVADAFGRFVEGGGARIFRSHGVNFVTGRCPHHRVRSLPPGVVTKCTSASGTAVFTSDIAIIGRNRTKSRKSEVKIPSVPMYVQMSTQVGINRPHDDGIKSRCNPPTIMIKRSNHMPALTHMQTKKTTNTWRRHQRNQKSCGESTLQKSMPNHQYHQYGPKMRFQNANRSS